MEAEPEIWPDAPPAHGIDAELAYALAELEELRSVFSEGEPTVEEQELGLAMIATVEAQIRDLEALARGDSRPDIVIG